jgi:Zn-dependent membrane protease YugP
VVANKPNATTNDETNDAMLILDHYWWFIIPGIVLGFYAQFKLNNAYGHYSQVPTNNGLSGAEAAREVLDSSGLRNVDIHEIAGQLTDYYDPRQRALFLSSDIFHGRSLASVGIAAHEAGHALQHAAAYAPLHLRMAMVPITNFASRAVPVIVLLGYAMHLSKLAFLGVIAFGIITLFQLITLPVEFDASRRAKTQLLRLGLVDGQERTGVSRVLGAAAMTYVAALVSSLMTLLHFVMMVRSNERD